MELNKPVKIKGNKSKSKRRGRGVGSGKGAHTTGSGQKGQKSRQGNSLPVGFEGGQVPIFKKLPSIGGFKSPTAKKVLALSISILNVFEDNTSISPANLVEAGLIKSIPKDGVKLLATGILTKKLTLSGFMYSQSAKELVEKSGSKILK